MLLRSTKTLIAGTISFLIFLLILSRPAVAEDVAAEISPDGVQRAEIILKSYSYTPDHLVVEADVPVELTLKSVTWFIPHNFVVEAPEAGLDIHQDVSAGDKVTIRFTPTQAGKFKFFCDKKLLFFASHEDKGMVGTLEVR